MATLRVCEPAEAASVGPGACSGTSLRAWLGGNGTLLFSHPDDFVRGCDLEIDRWLHITGDAFRQANIRPLALSRQSCPIDRGWVSQLSGDDRVISLFEAIRGRPLLDLDSCRLRTRLECIEERFVMMIDAALYVRWLLLYRASQKPPSPLDLVRLADRRG